MSEMRYRKSPDTFIRICGNESVAWQRRTYACRVFRDAEAFLGALGADWKSEAELTAEIASALGVSEETVSGDVSEFFAMLAAETFAEREGGNGAAGTPGAERGNGAAETEEESDELPLGDFFSRHGLPAELHMDLTNACTERCVHCYIPDYTPRFLPLDLGKKILREFREAGGLTVHFSGGECMLHPDFAAYLRFARELGLNMLVLSNLTRCDAEKTSLLREVDPQFVNVSLYSMNAAEHDAVTTVPGSWKRTMEAILALKAAGVAVRLAAPIMRPNRGALPALRRFAREQRMHLIPDCDIFGQTNHDCSNMRCALSPAELEATLSAHPEAFYKHPPAAERLRPECAVCDVGRARIDVDSRGIYYPCDGCHGLTLGDARETTFGEVWRGEKLNRLRALRNADFGECASCANRRWCKVCPARNFNETGDLFRHLPERCAAAAIRRRVFENFDPEAARL